MNMRTALVLLSFACASLHGQNSSTTLVPYAPASIQDKKGNEWYIEQNGALQRQNSAPSMIGNGMMLNIGNQQFYSQQPMVTTDGKEITMASPQPMNGLSVNRRVNVMEREGALRYVEELLNTTSRDLTLNVELRHSFNNPNKAVRSDTGRELKGGLEAGEFGVLVMPSQQDKSPAILLAVCAPGTRTPPRIVSRDGYQVSVFYNVTIPAGQSATIIHAIAQAKMSATGTPEEITAAFKPISIHRLTKGISKPQLKAAINLATHSIGLDMDEWFPERFWDVSPEVSDTLVLDDTSRLTGRVSSEPPELKMADGTIAVPWDQVAAVAGPGFTHTDQSWVWLRDGQRWKGVLTPAGIRFTLTAGAELDLPKLNRLILRRPPEAAPPALSHVLLETWSGERLAFQPQGALAVDTPWGAWTVEWSDILALSPAEEEALGGLLQLRDGTRLRVLPAAGTASLSTKSFGARTIQFGQLRRVITPQAAATEISEDEPSASFADLAGEQRLIGRVTTEKLRFITDSGAVDLAPAAIRELRENEEEPSAPKRPTRYVAELWGSGTLVGTLENTHVRMEGRQYSWDIPIQHVTRIVNPIPVADNALMRRTGELIQTLGDAEWKNRERATAELRELGVMAKGSLQEALKQSTDPEVTRRLETLLSEME